MELWIVLECGYEDGDVNVIATFKTFKEANECRNQKMKERDEEDQDWLWYSIEQIIAPL